MQSLETVVVFKSYDKSSGVSLRSSKVSLHRSFSAMTFCPQMKTPMTLGQKKAKTIEQLLQELGLSESHPFPPSLPPSYPTRYPAHAYRADLCPVQ